MAGAWLMAVIRGFLAPGNSKLGQAISVWSIPAVLTCPGRSAKCEAACYANGRGRFRFASVKERLLWNWRQAQRGDFVEKMCLEIARKGCQVVRIHGSGDFADAAYAGKWLEVMRRKPKPRYYLYSRSWRCPDIEPVLVQMAALKCCRVWYSTDSETGIPAVIPPGVRLAHLQTEAGEPPALMDLRFSVRKLRKLRLPMACPQESKLSESCGDCGKCFR